MFARKSILSYIPHFIHQTFVVSLIFYFICWHVCFLGKTPFLPRINAPEEAAVMLGLFFCYRIRSFEKTVAKICYRRESGSGGNAILVDSMLKENIRITCVYGMQNGKDQSNAIYRQKQGERRRKDVERLNHCTTKGHYRNLENGIIGTTSGWLTAEGNGFSEVKKRKVV